MVCGSLRSFLKYPSIMIIYPDTGGSKLIGEGKIKLKNDSLLEAFTETGLRFEDGSDLQADVIVFAAASGKTGIVYLASLKKINV